MRDVADKAIGVFAVLVALSIIFVSAGRTGESGGKQSADVIRAFFGGAQGLASGLEQK